MTEKQNTPTLAEVMKNVDTGLWVNQKEWLQRQISELEPSGSEASGMPEGILNLMDALQDAAEEELDLSFYPVE